MAQDASTLFSLVDYAQVTARQGQTPRPNMIDMGRVATIVMGGGQGSRLFPLTQSRCKPAICYGGRFRLIDVPISNALNSGCKRIFVLTQFLARTLHSHLLSTYHFDSFCGNSVEVLPAEENLKGKNWFQGTADAVRQHLDYLAESPADYFLILSGDQVYSMDYRNLLRFAIATEADAVVACLPVGEAEAKRMGVMQIDGSNMITSFFEKPQLKRDLNRMALQGAEVKRLRLNERKKDPSKGPQENVFLGSMGIYLFKREALIKLLKGDTREDFGKHLIPTKVKEGNIAAYIHQGYWEDIGTIDSFYKANMALTTETPPFNLYNDTWRLFTQPTALPGARISNTVIKNSMISEGSFVYADEVSNSIVGLRAIIGKGTILRDTYMMGNDFYAPQHASSSLPKAFSIGENCLIKKTIIDKHVHIGNRVQLTNKENLDHYDSDLLYIRDGIIVVPRGSTIPDGFII